MSPTVSPSAPVRAQCPRELHAKQKALVGASLRAGIHYAGSGRTGKPPRGK